MSKDLKEIQEFIWREKIFPVGVELTLARIFNALPFVLGFSKFKDEPDILYVYRKRTNTADGIDFKWKFLNKNESEATFQDQTEETQLAIAKLLGYEEVKDE